MGFREHVKLNRTPVYFKASLQKRLSPPKVSKATLRPGSHGNQSVSTLRLILRARAVGASGENSGRTRETPSTALRAPRWTPAVTDATTPAAPTCLNPEPFSPTKPGLPAPETHEHTHRKRSRRGLRVSMRKVGLGLSGSAQTRPRP